MVLAESEIATTPHVAVVSSPGMGHIIPLFEFARCLVTLHGLHVSFLNITTEASTAQMQLLHSPNLPSGLDVVDLPLVDLSTLVSKDALVLTRLSINVEQSFGCLKSVLLNLVCIRRVYKRRTRNMGDHGDDDKKAHVVVLASPGMGHVTPLLELAKTLVLHLGFHVSFLAIPAEEASPAQIHLLRSPNLPPDLHVIDLPRAHVSSTLRHDMGVFSRLCVVVREALRFLPPFLNQNSVNALITDPFCLAAFDIFDDDDVSVPTYVFFTSSASLLALTFYLPTLDEIVVGDYSKISDEVRVPGCKPLPVEDLINDVLDRQVLPISNRLPTVAGILLNTWEELEQRMNARMLIEMGLAVKPEVGEGKRVVGWSEIEKVVRMIVEGEQGMLIRSRVREFQNSALRAFNNGSLACVANQWKVESGL
ncbi:hypothetical protein FEM48_Zijuj06G0078600 [Ziziphus jujuba var. spinosa]|uniref:Uncharacterized protein n=1 Tax=Ziziphus jujuba var. spinosa TaxID=714518 RepID=A0A978V826_ZIZJJ|nr:hypothetical protein FEM48_Zijuj06G0078600 [Ziziphus jujuba var. spinosa]